MDHNEQDNSYEIETLSLVDEDGVEHEFEIADVLEEGGREYMALIPIHDGPEELLEDSAELVILRLSRESDDGGEPFLEAITDEDEYDKVAGIFVERLADYYDFEDGADEDSVKH